ncbi:kinetochore protein Spc25-like [Mya arenaria]|uniref:kinetochore protein Spc25-like n=1 Tax=Mya arenaria TaxID=6604 RepID=UPI0022E4F5CF|nr:kinetochore protein Spc25-like [Mya arenaria]XP_052773399.1 kinetochore protein Spc25-like [Mya arenaria]
METSLTLEQELSSLQPHLRQAQEKVGAWMKDDLDEQFHNAAHHHEQALLAAAHKRKDNVKVNQLYGVVEQLRSELEELYAISRQTSTNGTQLQANIDSLKSDISQLKQEIEAPSKAKQKLEYLEKASGIFGEMLGLRFKKTKGNRMQVVLTQIDEKEPEAPFYFFLQIQGVSRKYVVSDIEPPIEGLDELTAELNTSNDLQRFICQVRSLFQQSVKTS